MTVPEISDMGMASDIPSLPSGDFNKALYKINWPAIKCITYVSHCIIRISCTEFETQYLNSSENLTQWVISMENNLTVALPFTVQQTQCCAKHSVSWWWGSKSGSNRIRRSEDAWWTNIQRLEPCHLILAVATHSPHLISMLIKCPHTSTAPPVFGHITLPHNDTQT